MALSIGISPTISGYLLSDELSSLSLTVSNGQSGYKTYWEADYPVFSSYVSANDASPVFKTDPITLKPKPRTFKSSIRAYQVKQMITADNTVGNWTSKTSNVSTLITGFATGKVYLNGSVTNWNQHVKRNSGKSSATIFHFFLQAKVLDNSKESLMGFLTSTADPTPGGLKYGFHLKSNGQFLIIIDGVSALSKPLWYKSGDVFKVERNNTIVRFSQNGIVIHESIFETSAYTYYPTQAFNTDGAGFLETILYGETDTAGAHSSTYYATSSPIQVYGLYPGQPQYGYKLTRDTKTLISEAEDGSTVRRVKGTPKNILSVEYKQRSYDEFKEMLEFWNHHQRHIPFIYRDIGPYDLEEHADYLVTIENQFEYTIEGPNSVSWSLALREV